MRRRNSKVCLSTVFAVLFTVSCIEQARATGYWNMPGTFAQRTGHGYGAGYHAPLLLGPVRCDGWGLGNQVRLPYSPLPNYGCGSGGDCGRMVEAPTSMESAVPTTTTAPAPSPMNSPVQ
jgi:hypothetical protein